MPKFLCVQRSLPSGDTEKPSPTEMQEMHARFSAWQEKFKDNIVDMGGKLGAGKLVTSGAGPDGPFVEIKERYRRAVRKRRATAPLADAL